MSEQQTLKFAIKNKSLFECLTNLGMRFEGTIEGEFSDAMRIVLPSGESAEIDGDENWSLPHVDACPSISTWIVATLLWEVEDIYPAKEADEYSDFAKELIALFNNANITHLDWEEVKYWSWEEMVADLSAVFGHMDGNIEEAFIEYAYGGSGEVDPCIYIEIHNGQRMSVHYSNQKEIETEDCEGLKFVVAGKLKYFESRDAIIEAIDEKGGSVSDNISKNTDYLICNDIRSNSSKMKKAKSLGISVLTESAFIRRFCDPYEFDDIKDEDEVSEAAWSMTYNGGVLDFVIENGTQPIVMEIWKDGKWQRGVSKQKNAAKNAVLAAKCEEAKNIASLIFAGEYGSLLRKLLLIKARDCLTAEDSSLVESTDVPFDEMCARGFLRFEPRPIRMNSQNDQNCFINVEKEKFEYGNGSFLYFTIICNRSICDLDEYKSRTLEIASLIVDSINGKDLDGTGKTYFMSCSSRALSDVHMCSSLTFTVGEDMLYEEQPDINIIKGYDIDNTAVAKALLETPSLRRMMELENVSDEDAYTYGYFRASQELAPIDGKSYMSWLTFNWDFSMGTSMTIETSLTIAPVSRDRKLLVDILSVIKEKLPSLSLPVRGELIYSKDNSEDEIKLADIYCGLIVFK